MLFTDINNIKFNTWSSVQDKDEDFRGEYYFKVHDTLFLLDLRITYYPERNGYSVFGGVFHLAEDKELFGWETKTLVDKYIKVNNKKGLIQAYEDMIENEGAYFYFKLLKTRTAREHITSDEWKKLHVESFISILSPLNEISWPWNDVAQCGSTNERRWRLQETCPECGTQLIASYVSSPAWTWKNLCGRAGMLTFCPHCQKQIRFHVECIVGLE